MFPGKYVAILLVPGLAWLLCSSVLSGGAFDPKGFVLWLGNRASIGCESTILLAQGRSATSTLAYSVVGSTGMRFCSGDDFNWFRSGFKEPFRKYFKPSVEFLEKCMYYLGETGALIHVKPEHLVRFDDAELRTPFEFFRAAKRAGFKNVITTFRENMLDREISSYQQAVSRGEAHLFHTANFIEYLEDLIELYNVAFGAALANDFNLATYPLSNLARDTCGVVQSLAMTALQCDAAKFACVEEQRQRGVSTYGSMESRVGHQAAEDLTEQLTGTPYEWMLNRNTTEWPSDVVRPFRSKPIFKWNREERETHLARYKDEKMSQQLIQNLWDKLNDTQRDGASEGAALRIGNGIMKGSHGSISLGLRLMQSDKN